MASSSARQMVTLEDILEAVWGNDSSDEQTMGIDEEEEHDLD